MKLEGLGRCSEEIGREQTITLLTHVHLPELICERTYSRLLVGWSLSESRLIDVFRLRLRSSIVWLLPRLARHLLLCELTLCSKTGREKLRGLRGLARSGAICWRKAGTWCRRCHIVRAIVRLCLTRCILPPFRMMLLSRRRGRGWSGVHAFRVRKRRLPLRPSRRSF